MIILKTIEELRLMRESAQLVSKTLGMIAAEIKPGVTTLHLDKLAHDFIKDHGGEPAFLGMYGFPNSLCISPNEEVVHGIPKDIPLEEGDILSVDCGVYMNGFYGDHAYSFEVGEVSPETKKLLFPLSSFYVYVVYRMYESLYGVFVYRQCFVVAGFNLIGHIHGDESMDDGD